jgi:hypothetical protein
VVRFETTDTLPTGLLPNTDYYIDAVSATLFKVCTNVIDAQRSLNFIPYTDAGVGTLEMIWQPAPGLTGEMIFDNAEQSGLLGALSII